MKTIEYVNNYREKFAAARNEDENFDVITELFNALREEMFQIADARHIKTWSSMDSLIDEFNKKANKISEQCGTNLNSNWFKTIMSDIIKQAKEKYHT